MPLYSLRLGPYKNFGMPYLFRGNFEADFFLKSHSEERKESPHISVQKAMVFEQFKDGFLNEFYESDPSSKLRLRYVFMWAEGDTCRLESKWSQVSRLNQWFWLWVEIEFGPVTCRYFGGNGPCGLHQSAVCIRTWFIVGKSIINIPGPPKKFN